MLNRTPAPHPSSLAADLLIAITIGAIIYASVLYTGEWRAGFNPDYQIDLSASALPLYAVFSALRGVVAYLVSLVFTLVVGYWAAKSKAAERFIIPLLDILQSIPVLGFLPGLVLGLVALFPHSNVGLELAAVLMIFTGQVWNMTFAFYSSLRSVPGDLLEATSVMGLSKRTRLLRLELPFSAVNLVWNSIMSMAGGWFFLTVCEAFTLGDREYRLPGVGAYMAVAIEKGDTHAMVLGVLAMAAIIVTLDVLIWRPALAWVHRFRLEASVSPTDEDQLVQFIFKNSAVLNFFRRWSERRGRQKLGTRRSFRLSPRLQEAREKVAAPFRQGLRWPLLLTLLAVFAWGSVRLLVVMVGVPLRTWLDILTDTSFTLGRVIASVLIGTLWAVPAGIWVSQDARRLKIAQPIAQLLASFPAPMLYPLVVSLFLWLGVDFSIVSMILMLLGVQWYILFNTMAGGLRIPRELGDAMSLVGSSRRDRWRYLYLPSVFPSLVTGWVTAAGGAWNASIVAEYISFRGQTIQTRGLGALISRSAAGADFPTLAACLVVMVVVVVLLNRYVWDRVYRLSQTRFRLDF